MLRKIMRKIQYGLYAPNEIARIKGVKFGKNPKFATTNFGTEPYLIEVGDNFETSKNVEFITHDGSLGVLRNIYDDFKDADYMDKIIIGDNVFIGLGAILLPGTRIGNNVIVGAGSVVKGELLSNSVYAGVPAKRIGTLDEYKSKMEGKVIPTFLMKPDKKELYIKQLFKIGDKD